MTNEGTSANSGLSSIESTAMIAFSSEANFLTIHYLEDLFEVVPDIRGAGSGPLVAGGALRLMFIFISSSCIFFLDIDGIILRGAGKIEEFFLPPPSRPLHHLQYAQTSEAHRCGTQ
jgi:hypothetical protein